MMGILVKYFFENFKARTEDAITSCFHLLVVENVDTRVPFTLIAVVLVCQFGKSLVTVVLIMRWLLSQEVNHAQGPSCLLRTHKNMAKTL